MKRDSGTYVGDEFILSFLRSDDDRMTLFEGYRCRLVGFKHKIVYVFNHHAYHTRRHPGVYKILGDPVVKLETDQVVEISLLNLSPVFYHFDDAHPKNDAYYHEKAKLVYLGPLPNVKCNVGDKVLIAQNDTLGQDIVTEVLDITIKAGRPYILIEHEGKILSLPQELIIDVLDQGMYSEFEKLDPTLKHLDDPYPNRGYDYEQDSFDGE